MKSFRTEVQLQPSQCTISYSDNIMLFGSCFAQNIGQEMAMAKFNAMLNPFGILFNPESIAQTINRILDNRPIEPNELFYNQGVWSNFNFHGSFSSPEIDDALQQMNNSLLQASQWIKNTSVMVITFGTSFVYRLLSTGQVVANCHKVDAKKFERERLSVDEIYDVFFELIQRLRTISPNMRFIFTVSPIRHLRDGLHENQLSKSILLLAIDRLCSVFSNVVYFPSYEILIDDLRDYRFYDEDMLHPSAVAIDYIWDKFRASFFDQQTQQIMEQVMKIERAVQHRPLNVNTDSFRNFVEQQRTAIAKLQQEMPILNFDAELEHYAQLLG
ncbi:MAG: GSCFA domain-containing protein [Salinivirgaceae bacterium]|nr:GSCFA domain-containing protein [Salinivirgaceae bacterium]